MCEQCRVCFMYLKPFLLPEFIILHEYETPTVSDRKTTGNEILLGMYRATVSNILIRLSHWKRTTATIWANKDQSSSHPLFNGKLFAVGKAPSGYQKAKLALCTYVQFSHAHRNYSDNWHDKPSKTKQLSSTVGISLRNEQ